MHNFLLIPDSFKGTMSSQEICDIMSAAIRNRIPDATIKSIPVADGGEGSVDAFLAALGGEKRTVTVQGPYGEPVDGFYGIIGNTAIIEMAAAAGLPLVGENRHAEKTSTYGVGQLILSAAAAGANRIIVGLGGSATNDGGCGAACAVGVIFRDHSGQPFVPVGETLQDIAEISVAEIAAELKGVEIITMCDVDNPLYGPQGAAPVFAPQKGADEAVVQMLDKGLQHLSQVVLHDLQTDISSLPGGGAAGGMGAGMVAFFNSTLQKGIETVLDVVSFDTLLEDADVVFTGEGKLDHQSLRGKVIMGVANRAKQKQVPVIAVVGDIGDDVDAAYDYGISAIFSINRVAVPFKEAKHRAPNDLLLTMDNILRAITIA